MYLREIILQEIQPCTAQGNRIKIKGALSDSVLELMPYLNAEISSAIYNKDMGWLTFRLDEKIVTLHAEKISVTKLQNETDAYETLDLIRDKINEICERKEEIIPNYDMKKMPTPIDIYRKLPKKNCKKCGEMTCLAFAGKLLTGNAKLKDCTMLFEQEYVQALNDIEDILQTFGVMK